MSSDTVLTLIIILWAIVTLFVLMTIGVIPAGAAPIWGDDDMTCGVWTYYAPGLAETVRQNREIPACSDCIGLAVTVDHAHLGQRIDIRHAGQWMGPFLVVDGGTGRHRPHLVGEVGFETAVAWRIGRPWWTCYRRVS